MPNGHRFWAAQTLLGFLANPLVLILLVASSSRGSGRGASTRRSSPSWCSSASALNFVQVYRSQRAASERCSARRADGDRLARRVGQPRSRREVVPGDVIDLRAGDSCRPTPRCCERDDLHVHEAALTGESLPVEKEAGASPDAPARARATCCSLGTSVVSGVGTALVTATGRATRSATSPARWPSAPPETEFERGTRRFGFLIMRTVIGAGAVRLPGERAPAAATRWSRSCSRSRWRWASRPSSCR